MGGHQVLHQGSLASQYVQIPDILCVRKTRDKIINDDSYPLPKLQILLEEVDVGSGILSSTEPVSYPVDNDIGCVCGRWG